VANSLPRRRQVTALGTLREIASKQHPSRCTIIDCAVLTGVRCGSLKDMLATLDTPVAWAVNRDYTTIDSDNVSESEPQHLILLIP
jgi:hypothetical protein